MNILVTGANGQLGNEMRLTALGSADNYVFTDVCEASAESVERLHRVARLRNLPEAGLDVGTEKLDICDLEAIRQAVAVHRIDAIVNCAAFTNVDAAESQQELAEKLNADAPANLAAAMKESGGLLIHISTDYVFGKEIYNTPCREDRVGTPTGVYGLTKLHGEQRIMASGCRYAIVRTAWLYSEFGKNFCRTVLQLTATKPQLKVVFDQVGTPTYAWDLAKALTTILADYALRNDASGYPGTGVYHFSNEGVCSWFDFTKAIQRQALELESAGLPAAANPRAACVVNPCHSDEFPSPVVRPAYSVLDKTKIKESFAVDVPYWTDSLRCCLRHLLE